MNLPFTEALIRRGKTDKQSAHSYGPIYDWMMASKISSKQQVSILEIGVSQFGGGSLLALADVFAPVGRIVGVDIDTDRLCHEVIEHPRIEVLKADAYSIGFVFGFRADRFDIIIDDAIHLPDYQMRLFRSASDLLTEDGIYCVEDILSKDWVGTNRISEIHGMGFDHCLVDISTEKQPDSAIIQLRRKHAEA